MGKFAYIIGICGAGMSALARWMNKNGYRVFGCDDSCAEIFHLLQSEGISIALDSQHCELPQEILENKDKTLVSFTPAVHPDHPKLQFFCSHCYKIFSRKELTKKITQDHFTIAIAGTHGKTTTTALVSHILHEANLDLTGFVGGETKNYGTNLVTCGNLANPNVVIEADEFDNFFHCLVPNIAIVTNVDGDHFDTFGNLQNYHASFKKFLSNTKSQGLIILHKSAYEVLIQSEEKYDFQIEFYDLENAPIHAENIFVDEEKHFHFDYVSPQLKISNIVLKVPGLHNVKNALAAITAALHLKIPEKVIRQAVSSFLGVKKRFNIVFQNEKNILIDDYAHHPVEITNLLQTIKHLYPQRTITVIFRPNQYSRTQNFLQQFAESLDLADQVIVVDIFTDREIPLEGISNQAIIDRMKIERKFACKPGEIIETLKKFEELDIVVNMGAGDSETFIDSIIDFLQK